MRKFGLSLGAVILTVVVLLVIAPSNFLFANNADFHDAPESAKETKNPFEGSADAATAGKPRYHLRCARCHGERGESILGVTRTQDYARTQQPLARRLIRVRLVANVSLGIGTENFNGKRIF